jgi:polyisoprenoid-binding protein YceI
MTSTEMTSQRITAPKPGRYRIDTEHSTVTFVTRHMFGLAPVRGTFALRDGLISVADPVTGSTVRASIAAASFRSGNDTRDATVLSRRLLDAEAHPGLTFTSTQVTEANGQWALHGEFEVRGVTRPVEVRLDSAEERDGTLRATAQVRIDRYDFGITAYRGGFAGRTLTVTLDVTARREPGRGSGS